MRVGLIIAKERNDMNQGKNITYKKIRVEAKNLQELEKLLQTAIEQLKQLQKTVGELQQFQLKVRSRFDE